MSWSLTLFRVAGSEIRIHLTFFLLLAWFGIAGYSAAGWTGAFDSILFIVAVFVCVVLHELGHAIAARRYGISTPDITLLPIGGLARLSRIPENPRQELVIAIAGPLVNAGIAGVLLLLGANLSLSPEDVTGYGQGFISQLAVINLYLFAFNLIPAFPMDGGRILRSLLAFRLNRRQATLIAARIGQGIAIVFAVFGLINGNFLLVVVATFVFLAVSGEASQSGLSDVAARMTVDQAMVRFFQSLSPQSSLGEASDVLVRTTQHEFPVVDGAGRIRGVVTRAAIAGALRRDGPTGSVLDIMVGVPTVPEGARLILAVREIYQGNAPIVGVIDQDGLLVGYVSPQNLADLAQRGPRSQSAGPGPWSRPGRG